ncbi:MAG TPA: hypothetical protein VGO11_09455, partial [Chthoniobacteraceae bacterium]|nr:hypothetical protein [Chthoniobacteraceae bacterium]
LEKHGPEGAATLPGRLSLGETLIYRENWTEAEQILAQASEALSHRPGPPAGAIDETLAESVRRVVAACDWSGLSAEALAWRKRLAALYERATNQAP